MKNYKTMSPEEKAQYDKMYEDNRGLVGIVIRKYFPIHLKNEEFQMLMNETLWEACLHYDQEKDGAAKFSSYAIKAMVQRGYREYETRTRQKRTPMQPDLSMDQEITDTDGNIYISDTIEDPEHQFFYEEPNFEKLFTDTELKVYREMRKKKSMAAAAESLGISRQRVHQIYQTIRQKLIDNIIEL